MKNRLIQLACVAVLILFGAFWLSIGATFQWNAEADNTLKNHLNATPIIEAAQTGVSIEEMRRQPTKQKRRITYGAELPAGVTPETIRRDREDPRTGCPACLDPKWTLHPNWQDSPMFKPGGAYEGELVNGKWKLKNGDPFSRTPLR